MDLDIVSTAEILRTSRRRFVADGAAALADELAAYAMVPNELLSGDISDTIRRNIDLLVTSLATGTLPDEGDLIEIRTSAGKRAEEGLPLEMIMWAYHVVPRVLLQRIDAQAREVVRIDSAVVQRIVDFLGVVTSAAAAGYLEEFQSIETSTRTAAERVLESLLTGSPRPTLDFPLADAYAVVALAIDEHPDEATEGVDAAMAARRKLRRVRSALDAESSTPLMESLTPDGGLALLPATPSADWQWGDLAARLGDAAQAPVTLAGTIATPEQVSTAARTSREILGVVRLLRLPPGGYQLADVAYEYQVTRPGPARRELAALIGMLDEDDLLLTLRTFVVSGCNRQLTARRMAVHPNTVDNRMRKIAALTGLDPLRDATRLQMALLARDAEQVL